MKAKFKIKIHYLAAIFVMSLLTGCDPNVRDDTYVINRTGHKIAIEVSSKTRSTTVRGYFSDEWVLLDSIRVLNVLPGDSVFAGSSYARGWAPSIFAKNDTILIVFNDTLVLSLKSPGDHSWFGHTGSARIKKTPEWDLTLWYLTDRHYRRAIEIGFVRPRPIGR